jgi:hypothetical protein
VATDFHKGNARSLSLTLAIAVATTGLLIGKFAPASFNLSLEILFVFSFPGLVIAAVVGGAIGIRTIHDPSLILAAMLNFAFYFLAFRLVLTKTLKPKA